jgi:hypothetical protein
MKEINSLFENAGPILGQSPNHPALKILRNCRPILQLQGYLSVNVTGSSKQIDRNLTKPDSLKVLKALIERYDTADDYNRPAVAWMLRRYYEAVYADDGVMDDQG